MRELEDKEKEIIVKSFEKIDDKCPITDIMSNLTDEGYDNPEEIVKQAIDEEILAWNGIDSEGVVSLTIDWNGEDIWHKYHKPEGEILNYDDTIKDIEDTLGSVPGFMETLPDNVLIQEWPIFKKYIIEDSEIPEKYRELIGLAIAANIKCPYCTLFHKSAAELRDASEEELAEVAVLASLTTRWSAILHAQNYDFDTFKEEVERIGDFLKEKK